MVTWSSIRGIGAAILEQLERAMTSLFLVTLKCSKRRDWSQDDVTNLPEAKFSDLAKNISWTQKPCSGRKISVFGQIARHMFWSNVQCVGAHYVCTVHGVSNIGRGS